MLTRVKFQWLNATGLFSFLSQSHARLQWSSMQSFRDSGSFLLTIPPSSESLESSPFGQERSKQSLQKRFLVFSEAHWLWWEPVSSPSPASALMHREQEAPWVGNQKRGDPGYHWAPAASTTVMKENKAPSNYYDKYGNCACAISCNKGQGQRNMPGFLKCI